MRDSMAHGGPDDRGLYIDKDNNVALGHRRLSIIDLTSLGHQPMSSEEGNIWITYNGEVYNFLELKEDLKNSGYTFQSNSDTEVILKAYQEWGEKAFEKLNGMFAFCIYDKRKNFLYLMRDHAGIKPLYYSIANKQLIFSSEVKAFKVFNKDWEENKDWRIYFLIFGHIPEPYTTLKDVYMLPKGSFLKFDLKTKKYSICEYESIKFTDEIRNSEDAISGVRDLFTKAVQRHLISDAPIGVFLSGGVDSSLITLIASQFQGENLRTLSIVFNEKDFSEERYQNLVTDKIHSKHRSYLVTEKDFINHLDDIFSAMDQPTVDGINTYFVSKCAKEEGLKAVLSGLGGDELFGGYPSFQRMEKIWPYYKMNGNLRKAFKLFDYLENDKYKKLSYLTIPDPLALYLVFRGLFSLSAVSKILGLKEKEIIEKLGKFYLNNHVPACGLKNFASYLETNLYMQNQLLKDTDFMSMRHSVEIRVPFLDRELMELVFSINEEVKFNKNTPKILLVKAFEGILPDEIQFRNKMGFTFPFDMWMRKELEGFIEESLSGSSAFNKPYITKLIDGFYNHKVHWSRVWNLVVLTRWLK
jgi:asparagine synthase (glutamine-hydrolysing)